MVGWFVGCAEEGENDVSAGFGHIRDETDRSGQSLTVVDSFHHPDN